MSLYKMTSENTDMKTLIRKRGVIKAQLTRFSNFLKECTDINQLNVRLAKFEKLLTEYEIIQTDIDLLDDSQDTSHEWKSFEDSYFELLSEAKSRTQSASIQLNKPNSSQLNQSSIAPISLPPIKLPIFSGDYDEWLSFHDSFRSLIHNNPNLTDCQKFHYLKLSLKDSAANVLQSLEGSAENYSIGWELLVERYQNKRFLINKHVTALFNLSKLNKESRYHLRNIVDDVQKHMRALHALGQPTNHWDTLIIHIITSMLDTNTHREWESETQPDSMPTLSELITFLKRKCQVLEAVGTKPAQGLKQIPPQLGRSQSSSKLIARNNTFTSNYVSSIKACTVCNKSHHLYLCDKFRALSITDREKEVRKLGLCFNCLSSSNHKVKNCGAGSCKLCGKRHNTLLHFPERSSDIHTSASPESSQSISRESNNSQNHSVASTSYVSQKIIETSILLSTVVVSILDNRGLPRLCRALLDSGSQSHFITERMVRRLGLPLYSVVTDVCGIGQSTTRTSSSVQCVIKSRFNSFSSTINSVVLKSITHQLPTIFIERSKLKIPSNLQLADPQFNQPGDIDLLIGAELFFDILRDGRIKLLDSTPALQNTVFGWVIAGKVEVNTMSNVVTACHLSTLDEINKNVQRFWDLEDCNSEKQYTGNDKLCERLFTTTTSRDGNGRYCVQIPLKGEVSELGESRDTALRRLLSVERRLSTKPEFHRQYIQFMKEYEELGHMQEITPAEIESSKTYYIPHHAVHKEDSTTTKLRVVFDASAKTSSGVSLNDISIVGPTVQSDLISIVTRFRTHRYVMIADIEKMYRQIKLHPAQQDLQRILWREGPDEPVKTFRLLTVTYGTASAPYLATRTLKQLALDEQHQLPAASRVVIQDFYVDDVMTGAETIEEARQLQQELIELTHRGAFHLRKWSANHPGILRDIPREDIVEDCFEINQEATVKTLGLIWNPIQDTFQFSINKPKMNINATKRSILSAIGKIFDPLGLIGPVIVVAKLIMQKLWSCHTGWDEEVPDELLRQWNHFHETLPLLSQLRVPRAIRNTDQILTSLELHGFCDASEAAYGACIYLKSIDVHGDITVNLITSKSRVAPLKKISLPRLELCGALLLSELCKTIVHTVQLQISSTTYYTDSTIVLAWIRAPSSHWTTFVANRVSKIQDNTNVKSWRHIKGEENPADYLSRGLLPSEILQADLYWKGPSFLHTSNVLPEETTGFQCYEEIPEIRHKVLASTVVTLPSIDLSGFSSFTRMQRVFGHCLRFIHNSSSKESHMSGSLSLSELQSAERAVIRMVQRESFPSEFRALKLRKPVDNSSKLITLNPFMDNNDVIRVGGRLQQSDLHPDQIHPIVLPKGHVLSELIARHMHIKMLHAGPQLLLNSLRHKYWPINGRNLASKIFRQCVACFKSKPTLQTQMMGELPKSRVQTPIRPFYSTGVDYCGPVLVKMTKRKGSTPNKCYIAIFVCFSTKALHLELVEDLTTNSFIAALRRFMSRRGKPKDIFSDNGTNFVGAHRELQELVELWKTEEFQKELSTTLSQNAITWHFQPPRAPHFGGLWESSVKLVKTHLKRVLGRSILTYVQFVTLLTQIEACINSRPLTPLSDDPNDLCPLTPSHFLIGDILTNNPEPSLLELPVNTLNHWQHVQQLLQHFWSRWSNDYLTGLQRRRKWTAFRPNLTVGDMVIVKEDNLPPLQWKMARVLEVHPGPDNRVRVVTIKTTSGTITRPITKLCLLPIVTSS